MGGKSKVDFKQLKEFHTRLKQAAEGGFKKELSAFLEGAGFEFLRIVEDEIIRLNTVDTRLLLNSFHKGSEDNIWELDEKGLTLEVGTNVKYAAFVNDGHWTNPKGVEQRFVPGDVEVDSNGKVIKFTYNPNAKKDNITTGIMLRQKWVEGKHYWESAVRIFEKMFPRLIDTKVEDWFRRYFKKFM